jgi:hypothetical protein
MNNIVRWNSIKEAREDYFVEYCPACNDPCFANLYLTFLHNPDIDTVVGLMEKELVTWIRRFPIPIMISSFDIKGDTIDLSSRKTSNYLMGFEVPDTHQIVSKWAFMMAQDVPDKMRQLDYRLRIYADLPHITQDDIRNSVEKHRRIMRFGWSLVFFWSVVIPVFIAVLGWTNPIISACVMVYALVKALIQALKLTGKWKKSPYDKEREQEDLAMRHHHYHCKRNPKGFSRLVVENFNRQEEDRTRKEFEDLKTTGSTPNSKI